MRFIVALAAAITAIGIAYATWQNATTDPVALTAIQLQEQASWNVFVSQLRMVTLIVIVLAAVGLFIMLAGGKILKAIQMILEYQQAKSRYIDGMAPLITRKMRDPNGNKYEIIWNPNTAVGSAAVFHPELGFMESNGGASWEHQLAATISAHQVAAVQAKYPGNAAYIDAATAIRAPLAGRSGADYPRLQPQTPAAALPEIESAIEPPPTASELTNASNLSMWALGKSAAGRLAYFQPDGHHHMAILGAPGTGKSLSMAYPTLRYALASGFHTIILDPKGLDFEPFINHTEYHRTDDDLFPRQIAALEQIAGERLNELRSTGKSNWWQHAAAGARSPRIFVLIEEFGILSQSLAQDTLRSLERLYKMFRASGIHLVLIDQTADSWPTAAINGSKARIVFQVDASTAGKVGAHRAPYLAPRGEFLFDGQAYTAADNSTDIRQLMATTPANRTAPLLGEAQLPTRAQFPVARTNAGSAQFSQPHAADDTPFVPFVREANGGGVPEVDPPPPPTNERRTNAQPAASPADDWYSWTVAHYLPTHPELCEVDARGNGRGIADLARAMAAIMQQSEPDNFKSTASAVARRLRATTPRMDA